MKPPWLMIKLLRTRLLPLLRPIKRIKPLPRLLLLLKLLKLLKNSLMPQKKLLLKPLL